MCEKTDILIHRCVGAQMLSRSVVVFTYIMDYNTVCSRPNWGGAWLHKAGALWNTKYLMENPMKTLLLLQVEVRDRSGSEEQRADPEGLHVQGDTECSCSTEPRGTTTERHQSESMKTRNKSATNQSVFQECFSRHSSRRFSFVLVHFSVFLSVSEHRDAPQGFILGL